MKNKLFFLFLSFVISTTSLAQEWSTATSSNHNTGRVIVFRFISKFTSNFDRTRQPNRIIIAWKYQSKTGMPYREERERMDSMEDVLHPALENDGFATLALVSTGEGLREWTYYVKSEKEFFKRLNKALEKNTPYPIDLHTAIDPKWDMYEKFKAGMQK